jgi:hypothetical protein
MAETRGKFDEDFKEGAVRLVRETGRPIAQVARDLGINGGTLGNWLMGRCTCSCWYSGPSTMFGRLASGRSSGSKWYLPG